jgi:alpha-N-arabinofuranosidase
LSNVAANIRNTDYRVPVGGVTLSIGTSSSALSSSLPDQMRMDIDIGTTGTVDFYNNGLWGCNVDANKRYIARMYMRGDYSGNVNCYF